MKATYHLAAPVSLRETPKSSAAIGDGAHQDGGALGTVSLADYVYLRRIDLIYLRRWRTASRNRELREASIVIRRRVPADELHRLS